MLPFEELYGLTNLLINLDEGFCELINLQEVSTLNVKKHIVMQPSCFFHN
jgi:hypothetical protein